MDWKNEPYDVESNTNSVRLISYSSFRTLSNVLELFDVIDIFIFKALFFILSSVSYRVRVQCTRWSGGMNQCNQVIDIYPFNIQLPAQT